ncbi:uncharacterized protein [Argopecten irradians]|uniref:uncharacterized protein n=1 Tax=Argopecten irradians TaxID=31199 RepID=UPI0037146CCB
MEKSVFHAGFLRGPGRPTRGYGIQKFSAEAYMALEIWIRQTFLKEIKKSMFSKWYTIRGAEDSLLNLLKDSPGNAELYIRQVLFKETITRIVMKLSSVPRKEAVSLCKSTESESWRKASKRALKKLESNRSMLI